MNALTILQPWASLIATGAKTIETRSWRPPASAIGEWLAIHAGAKRAEIGLIGDSGWCVHHHIAGKEQDRITAAEQRGTSLAHLLMEHPRGWGLPLGAVVASCVLADVVPIVADHDDAEGLGRYVCTTGTSAFLWHDRDEEPHTETLADFMGQVPFGDFSPGRFAWLLEDVKPTMERCPWCAGVGQVNGSGEPAPLDHWRGWVVECPVCEGLGYCDPIPAVGHQRIWQWKPEEGP